jgi:hypothetical protein
MLAGASKAPPEMLPEANGDLQELRSQMRTALDELQTALDEVKGVLDNMCVVQQKLHAAQIQHRQLRSLLLEAQDELRTSQISFALVYMSYKDVRKALDQFSEEPAAKHKRHALQLAYTLAQSAHTLAQKAYAESYERVQEAEQAVLKRKAELSAQRQ